MRRTKLLEQLRETARANGLELVEVREGANHTLYRVGTYQFPVAATARSTSAPPERPSREPARRADP